MLLRGNFLLVPKQNLSYYLSIRSISKLSGVEISMDNKDVMAKEYLFGTTT